MNDELKYHLALSILNNTLWILFQDLEKARRVDPQNFEKVSSLKIKFAEVCSRRDGLSNTDASGWQSAIDEFTPFVNSRSEALKHAE